MTVNYSLVNGFFYLYPCMNIPRIYAYEYIPRLISELTCEYNRGIIIHMWTLRIGSQIHLWIWLWIIHWWMEFFYLYPCMNIPRIYAYEYIPRLISELTCEYNRGIIIHMWMLLDLWDYYPLGQSFLICRTVAVFSCMNLFKPVYIHLWISMSDSKPHIHMCISITFTCE